MKAILIFFFFASCSFASYSQHFILDKKWKIKKNMEQFYKDQNRKYLVAETDSSLSYILNDSISLPATTIFYFNEQDRCIKQENIFSCDSCLQQSLQRSLEQKFINWKKAGTASYYAAFPYNTLMEQVRTKELFILRYTWLKRKAIKDNAID